MLYFSAKKHAVREDFGVNARNADHRDLKLAPDSVFGSPEERATCGIGSVQWRHHVMMRVTTLVDQDSRNFTWSTWQLWYWGVMSTIV